MQKMSRRGKMFSNHDYAAKVMTTRFKGLQKILTLLSRGTSVSKSEAAIYHAANQKGLF
ncbi:hypothetical protein VspSw1_43 [Vibrio phage VspSw_1]|uniref:Uncharacterized protein n=1 Tax=Vibrio phage VspSw_1 TaxID=2484249 RepID=A0A411BKK6_9CAUD|nr:hypothetical protein HOV08_gp043 [Vibrio phage VspSw_1]QAY02116.1 hypothetical protein VspSw1_43 [Vibrio phage VspSw_1]